MHHQSLIRATAVSTVGAATFFALAAPAWAGPKSDPAGANGTVKIDSLPFDSKISNQPHVTCEFRIKFFDFDANEHGNIVLGAQAPSGKDIPVLRRNNVPISNDAAKGGKPDPDEIYTFSADDLGRSGLKLHPKQGYHLKLTVERIGAPGAGEHKVFWLQPCQPTEKPTTTPTPTPTTAPPPSGSGGGKAVAGAELPITGAPVAATAGLGVALIAGGVGLIFLRRRFSD